MDIEKIVCDVKRLTAEKNVTVIGIDGLGGAGKSTVSEKLCDALAAQGIHTVLLHIDDFIHTRSVRYDPAYPEWQCYYDIQWRYDHFAETIAAVRKAAGSFEAELYDKENDCYSAVKFTADNNTAVIAEGIFLQRKELRGLFDYMIYIDIPENVRLGRVLKRDTYIGGAEDITGKYERRYFPAERRYVSEYDPAGSADIVIYG